MSDHADKNSNPNRSGHIEDDEVYTWSTPFGNDSLLDDVPATLEASDEVLPEPENSEADDEPIIPAHSAPLIRPPYREAQEDEPNIAPDTDSRAGSKLPLILATTAVLIAAAALLMQFNGSATTSGEQQKALLKAAAERSGMRLQELDQMNQELNRRIRMLEAQLESLSGTVEMQSRRIDSKFGKITPEATNDTAAKTVTPTTGWAVNLMSMDDKAAATKERDRLIRLGIPAEISPFYIDKQLKYRIRITGFADQPTAEAYKEKLAIKHGIKDAWVYKP